MTAESLLFLPGPVMVAPEVLAAQHRPLIDHRGPAFAEILHRCSTRLAPIFGTTSDVVLLGSSGTGGLEAAVANLVSPGERWLAAPVGVFGKRLAAIAQHYGAIVEELPTEPGACMNPTAFAQRLTDDRQHNIRGVLLTHNETSTGVQNDLAALVPALREHGALSIVDSVSGLAASPMHMDAWGFDVVVSASQKALAAPPGVAMIAVSQRAWEAMERSTSPRYYFDLRMAREFSRKGQTPWTPPISIVYALDASLDRYVNEGPDAFMARHVQRAALVRERLGALGFTIFSHEDAHSVTVVAARPPSGIAASDLVTILREEHGVVISGGQGDLVGKIVRIGTIGAFSDDQLDRALQAVATVVKQLSYGDSKIRA